jgi:Pentapeptide repeats (8 copies)
MRSGLRSPNLGWRSLGSPNLGSLNLGSFNLGALRLGAVNLALISFYFIPAWGGGALRALISPFGGLQDRTHAAAAFYFSELFNFGFSGLVLTSHILAGIKLVSVAAFVAYVIEFARAWVIGRAADRETIDVVLILAVVGLVLGALPAMAVGDAAIVRLCATQIALIAGAVMVIAVERNLAAAVADDAVAAPKGNTAFGNI